MTESEVDRQLRERAAAVAAASRRRMAEAMRDSLDGLKTAITAQVARIDAAAAGALDLEDPEAIEQLCAALESSLDSARSQLETEARKRESAGVQLEALHERLARMKAEADAMRQAAQAANERVQALEDERAQHRPGSDVVCGELDHLAGAMAALVKSGDGGELLTTVVNLFGDLFGRVVLCLAQPAGPTVVRGHGFDPPLQRNTVLPVAPGLPLDRAIDEWQTVCADVSTGLGGAPARYAVAIPIVAEGRGNAILYAENGPDAPRTRDDRVAGKIAEILGAYVRTRLRVTVTMPATIAAPAAANFSKQRQAARIKMRDGTVALVNDAQGLLVDLSALGAQLLSPRALEPNSDVQIMLPTDAGAVACTARVVWVLVDWQSATPSARYRAGVQFTDVKMGELEAYLQAFDTAIKH